MIDVKQILTVLSRKRPLFHSEADFQHALAWEIHQQRPTCSIRLEFRPPHLNKRCYLDIWAVEKDVIIAIELKYKTRKLYAKIDKETFDLLDQSAQDLGRYDFLKDIQRLEQIVFKRKDIVGYAIFLTNDSAYWIHPRNNQTVDASFRIHQGKTLTGELNWGARASKGTKNGRGETIFINSLYNLYWQDFSKPSQESYGKFRYLLVEIKNSGG